MGRRVVWVLAFVFLLLGCLRTNNVAADIDEKEEIPKEPTPTGYEIICADADGKNGFYRTIPEITIQSKEPFFRVKYCITKGETKEAEGEVESLGEIKINEAALTEGIYKLSVWMENSEGEEVPEFRKEKEYRIDSSKPDIQLSAPNGFEAWYQEPVSIEAMAGDSLSGVEEVCCYINGKLKQKGEKVLSFVLQQEAAGGKGIPIRIEAVDLAGNVAVKEERIFLDLTDPVITVDGITNLEICASPKQAQIRIQDQNILNKKTARISKEEENGTCTDLQLGEWKMEGDTAILTQNLETDGIYRLEIAGEDISGRMTSRKMQVIIDQSNPVISFLEQMGGKVLQEFVWDYNAEEMIKDFTSYDFEVKLDGRNYTAGEKITREGAHNVRVWARDAAGNESEKTISFLIDRTAPEILIDGVQEEEIYDKNVEFKVRLKEEADWVEQILINGEEQKLSMESQIYEYTCEKEETYEIQVSARDVAGNKSIQKVHFQINKPKGVIEKVMTPLKNVWTSAAKKSQIDKQDGEKWILGGVILFVLVCAAAGGLWVYRCRKNP